MNGKWGLLLALAGGVAIGSALAMGHRSKHRRADKHLHKQGLQAWEDEGGSVAVPRSRVAVPTP